MKSLKEYIVESTKTYPFKIGVAGVIPEGFDNRLRNAMEKFSVVSQLENTEVTYWDVEIRYPTTDAILHEYLSNVCTVAKSSIVVRNANARISDHDNEQTDDNATYEVLLTKEDLAGPSAQADVGGNRVMELLKELEAARKERADNTDGFKAEAMKEEPQNTKSAMGS